MARLRWRIQFESLWSSDLPQLATGEIPARLKGRDRIAFVQSRTAAQELIKTLFPEDTDGES